MLVAVLSGFVLATVAPWICRMLRGAGPWVLALLPLGLTLYFASFIGTIAAGEKVLEARTWVPTLEVRLAFQLDGLSLVFALLISGIGTLVFIYAGGYLAKHPQIGRFFSILLLFMASMLGLVLSDNLISLFVFWELTSLTSYLLIGFDHTRERARWAALQALLVTALGGLAMLAGFLLMGAHGMSLELSVLAGRGDLIREHPLYLTVLLLVLLGAFTKSAQFPFHFWLPNAMEAPTPVSAYLHSATMVKAGVYLLARVHPILGETVEWQALVSTFGAATVVAGAFLAFRQTDLKRILAYTTVASLGVLVLALGLGTPGAAVAAMTFLIAHSFYKGALFLVAGALDHETGARDLDRLGGLAFAMPLTALAAFLAAFSMAGLPPFLGFMSKELLYEATLEAPLAPVAFTAAAVAGSALMGAMGLLMVVKPFFGTRVATPKKPHEAPFSMTLGPLLLAGLGTVAGIAPGLLNPFVSSSSASVLGYPFAAQLSLWHGLNVTLLLSVFTVISALTLWAGRAQLLAWGLPLRRLSSWGPAGAYDVCLDGLNAAARLQTRFLQNGYLRFYLLTVILTTLALVSYTLAGRMGGLGLPAGLGDLYLYEAVLAVLILLAALATVLAKSRLAAIASLGFVGFGVALTFILFAAPDLALTQFLVETLSVILFVLVLYHLPRFSTMSTAVSRARDGLVAVSAGGMMTLLLLVAGNANPHPPISEFFGRSSLTEAHGRNIVNVILVDFRALDTLGEITVLALAGIGVFALLKLRLGERSDGK